MPHKTVFFLIDDFEVGDGGMEDGIPIDEAFAAINQAFVI